MRVSENVRVGVYANVYVRAKKRERMYLSAARANAEYLINIQSVFWPRKNSGFLLAVLLFSLLKYSRTGWIDNSLP